MLAIAAEQFWVSLLVWSWCAWIFSYFVRILFFLVVCSPSLLYFFAKHYFSSLHLLHCVLVHFGGGAMKKGVCLLGLISNINSVSWKSLFFFSCHITDFCIMADQKSIDCIAKMLGWWLKDVTQAKFYKLKAKLTIIRITLKDITKKWLQF